MGRFILVLPRPAQELEGAHVVNGVALSTSQVPYGEKLCWSKQSHFSSIITASSSELGNDCTERRAKEEKVPREILCVAVEKVYAGGAKLCP